MTSLARRTKLTTGHCGQSALPFQQRFRCSEQAGGGGGRGRHGLSVWAGCGTGTPGREECRTGTPGRAGRQTNRTKLPGLCPPTLPAHNYRCSTQGNQVIEEVVAFHWWRNRQPVSCRPIRTQTIKNYIILSLHYVVLFI